MTIARIGWWQRLRGLRALVDFELRKRVQVGRPVLDLGEQAAEFETFQNEILAFLKGVGRGGWGALSTSNPVVLDIGAKDFSAGPAIEKYFLEMGLTPKVVGVEIDAFRRLADLRTRKDYGDFFARSMKAGEFHAMDFLEWKETADVLVLLHPFVVPEPLLKWGLPLKHFRPAELVAHCRRVLEKRGGVLVVSTPCDEEQSVFESLALASGFIKGRVWRWEPVIGGAQKVGRIGSFWRVGAAARV